MNRKKVLHGVWILLAIMMVFASAMIIPSIKSSSSCLSTPQLIYDSVFCQANQPETGSFSRLLISCSCDSILVETTLVHHQFQVNILLDGWDWKIDQVIWQIPRT
jgi:hypothetical protein